MIYIGKIAKTLDEARELAQAKLLDGSGYRKLKDVIAAQGGNPQVLDRFELLPNATGAQEITTSRGGYISGIDAALIGQASSMIGAGRDTKDDAIDPAVGVILEVKVGQKIDAGSILCRIYHTSDERLEDAAELVEDAFKISQQPVDEKGPDPRSCQLALPPFLRSDGETTRDIGAPGHSRLRVSVLNSSRSNPETCAGVGRSSAICIRVSRPENQVR